MRPKCDATSATNQQRMQILQVAFAEMATQARSV
jgi:hypothetical protein